MLTLKCLCDDDQCSCDEVFTIFVLMARTPSSLNLARLYIRHTLKMQGTIFSKLLTCNQDILSNKVLCVRFCFIHIAIYLGKQWIQPRWRSTHYIIQVKDARLVHFSLHVWHPSVLFIPLWVKKLIFTINSQSPHLLFFAISLFLLSC